jgi:sterol desaturase/sphingolipid hydroxylase (fatty acid hydroxylase superfamily)
MILPYWAALGFISLAFVVLERVWPWRAQAVFRRGILTDLIYLVFNGHVLALLLAHLAGWVTPTVDRWVVPVLGRGHAAGWPLWVQFLTAFFVVDLIQWGIHNLMHRVPQLWALHRVHHSISDMDWLGSMRFHWLEIVVYRTLQYLPLLLLGFNWQVFYWLAIFSTAMGHFNHSNLKVHLGPLKYLLNHPAMHIWHHDIDPHGPAGCNFAINLSLWDWLFGTVYQPVEVEQPEALGFTGLAEFPANFVSQQLVPLTSGSGMKRESHHEGRS